MLEAMAAAKSGSYTGDDCDFRTGYWELRVLICLRQDEANSDHHYMSVRNGWPVNRPGICSGHWDTGMYTA